MRATQIQNSFAKFSQFSASPDSPDAISIKIWFPFLPGSLPLDVSIAKDATVQETIGCVLFHFTEDATRPTAIKVRWHRSLQHL